MLLRTGYEDLSRIYRDRFKVSRVLPVIPQACLGSGKSREQPFAANESSTPITK
jgi:hypothetical protein